MIVGLIANPVASKDIRRLVGMARVVDIEEKSNLIARLLAGMAGGPPVEVHALDDPSALVRRALRLVRDRTPPVRWLPVQPEGSEADSRNAARALASLKAAAVVTVGGDGTVRATVEGWSEVPLVPIAAGTNNTIALTHPPTAIGLAVAHTADPMVAAAAFAPIPRLIVDADATPSAALVDAVGVRTRWTGARALWEPAEMVEAVVTKANPTAIGLAAVAAAFGPIPSGHARYLRFGTGRTVRAVFGPGLVLDFAVAEERLLPRAGAVELLPETRVVALDGERRLVTRGRPTITVADGPRLFDPVAAMRAIGDRNRETYSSESPQ